MHSKMRRYKNKVLHYLIVCDSDSLALVDFVFVKTIPYIVIKFSIMAKSFCFDKKLCAVDGLFKIANYSIHIQLYTQCVVCWELCN